MKTGQGRSLTGARVLITRRYEDSRRLAEEIIASAGTASCIPLIEIVGPADADALNNARRSLVEYDWLVFTSRHSARSFLADLPPPPERRPGVAVVGEATHNAVEEAGWPVDLAGKGTGASALARDLVDRNQTAGKTFLYPCSNLARNDFATEVMNAGAQGILTVETYRVIAPLIADDALDQDKFDIIVFASPSAVEHLASHLADNPVGTLSQLNTVSIGRTTTEALRQHGAKEIVESETTDHWGLLKAIREAWNRRNPEGRTEQ